jgi:hypothetical protein
MKSSPDPDFFIPENISEIFEKLKEDYGLTDAQIKNIVAHQFRQLRKIVIRAEYPSIFLKNLGTFETFPSIINVNIKYWIHAYRKGEISKAQVQNKVGKLWKLRNVIMELNGKSRIPNLNEYLPRKKNSPRQKKSNDKEFPNIN